MTMSFNWQAVVVIVVLLVLIYFIFRMRNTLWKVILFIVALIGVAAGVIEVLHEFDIHIGTHD